MGEVVLILVLVEHTLRAGGFLPNPEEKIVLILVLVEHTLRATGEVQVLQGGNVLILVLVEHTLREKNILIAVLVLVVS